MTDLKTVTFDALCSEIVESLQCNCDGRDQEGNACIALTDATAIIEELFERCAAPTPAAQSAGQEAVGMYVRGVARITRELPENTPLYAAPVNGGERDLGRVIDERDQYHDAAEKLADAIAKHFGVEIGEHSNLNCPWQNALDHIAQETKRAADVQQVGVCVSRQCRPLTTPSLMTRTPPMDT